MLESTVVVRNGGEGGRETGEREREPALRGPFQLKDWRRPRELPLLKEGWCDLGCVPCWARGPVGMPLISVSWT